MASQITEAEFIWVDGKFVHWQDANVHILSQAVMFGASLFEGIRCYKTPDGPAIFRLREHIERLFLSCKVYRMDISYSADELVSACCAAVEKNSLGACYVRPMVMRGYGAVGMLPFESPVQVCIPAWPWGTYLGVEALERGIDACVSSWQRAEPNTFPMLAKAAGNYNNAQLIKMQAAADGYAEAIALGPNGLVSEGSGQNFFMVRKGVILTPPLDGSLLAGITRDSVITLAREEGIEVREVQIPREMLYMADEMFFTGTATEVVPIRSVDRINVGNGKAGPITMKLQRKYLGIVEGREPDRHGWLTHTRLVKSAAGVGAA